MKRTKENESVDILSSARFEKAGTVRHHITGNVAEHSRNTAEYGRRMCEWLNRHGIDVSEEDVVQACLLHDIGMTEDRVHDSAGWRKAFWHPRKGARIARDEYHVNKVQYNAIKRHMWPICIIPPRYKEGWVVMAADKYCSIRELSRKRKMLRP